jgi:hypothetical protein
MFFLNRVMAIAVLGMVMAIPAMAGKPRVTLPFVGCPSDGQIGAEPAPQGARQSVDLDPRVAARLAYYKSDYNEGVIAPRGWHCVALEGSNGSILFVTKAPVNATALLFAKGRTVTGPAIQLNDSIGDTSGRWQVATLIARYFPGRMTFVRGIIKDGFGVAADFPRGPYAGDRLISRQPDMVEYETPPNTQGLGTADRLRPNGEPIRSVALLLGDTPDARQLAVRLDAATRDLLPVILHQFKTVAGTPP